MSHIYTEMSLHIGYCKEFGISKEEIENTEEHQGELVPLLQELPPYGQD